MTEGITICFTDMPKDLGMRNTDGYAVAVAQEWSGWLMLMLKGTRMSSLGNCQNSDGQIRQTDELTTSRLSQMMDCLLNELMVWLQRRWGVIDGN
jgi:hypothetical protein